VKFTRLSFGLYAQAFGKLENPGAHIVLPESFQKSHLDQLFRQGDDGWLNLTKCVVYAIGKRCRLGVSSCKYRRYDGHQKPCLLLV